MSVENFQGALRIYLLSDVVISALVGDDIFSIPVPQNHKPPFITIQFIDDEVYNDLYGFNGVIIERWQIDVYSEDIDELHALKKAVFDKLHMKHGENWSGYKIYLSKSENTNYISEPKDDGSENIYHRIQQDFKIKRSYETIN